MAATFNNEERERRIKLVTDYIIETGASYRETAKFFTDNYFKISHVTVKDYCDRVIFLDSELSKKLKEVIKENTKESINDEETIKRILNVSNIYVSTNFTILEIAENLGLSYWTVYRDITSRIKKIEVELPKGFLEKIEEKLENDRISNLENQSGKIK
ncbi:MAG: sporulation transcriptional regulator SpoIIID [Bacilli bacterium]